MTIVPPGNNLPNWLRWGIIAAFAVTLIINVGLDYRSDTYDGQFESLILAGLVGTALGFETIRRDQ